MKYLKTTPYGKAKAKILLLSPLLVAYRTVQWRWVRPSLLAPHWLLLGCLLPPATLYQLLQGYDFLHLYETKNCKLQMGGSDQWGTSSTHLL